MPTPTSTDEAASDEDWTATTSVCRENQPSLPVSLLGLDWRPILPLEEAERLNRERVWWEVHHIDPLPIAAQLLPSRGDLT